MCSAWTISIDFINVVLVYYSANKCRQESTSRMPSVVPHGFPVQRGTDLDILVLPSHDVHNEHENGQIFRKCFVAIPVMNNDISCACLSFGLIVWLSLWHEADLTSLPTEHDFQSFIFIIIGAPLWIVMLLMIVVIGFFFTIEPPASCWKSLMASFEISLSLFKIELPVSWKYLMHSFEISLEISLWY